MKNKKKTDRSGVAFGGDQCGVGAGEVDTARASVHVAFVVGAAAFGGGTSCDLVVAGR